MLNRNDLDELSQKEFDLILVKLPHELTEYDIGYLKARISYLTDAELEKYDSALNSQPSKPSEKPLDKMNLDELIVKANEVGIILTEGKTKKELKALIEDQQTLIELQQ